MSTTLAANVLAATSTSTGEALQFWVLGTVAVLGALGTILMRRAVHSALCLGGTMIILAVFYLANGAYFLGMVQIVVYTGAVMMLFLFVLMLVGISTADTLRETIKGQRWLALLCCVGFSVLLIGGIGNASVQGFTGLEEANSAGNVLGLAELIFTEYIFAFEITGALLVTAAVAAMVLTHRERIASRGSQREQSRQRVRENVHVPPLPAPGVYARHNAVDIPALLPDGTPSELTVNPTLRGRGQVRDVSSEAMADLAALEQRTEEHLGRDRDVTAGTAGPVNGAAGNRKGAVNGAATGISGQDTDDAPPDPPDRDTDGSEADGAETDAPDTDDDRKTDGSGEKEKAK